MAWQDSDTTGGKIRLKHSQVAAETIGPSGLVPGEIALNAADGSIHYLASDGTVGTTGLGDAPSDGIAYGRKNEEWVDLTSPANLQVRRGTAAEVAAITPLAGEPVWATDTKRLTVGDGGTPGGILIGRRTYYWSETGNQEEARSVGAPASNTADPNASVTLGPVGTYLVFTAIRFEAEEEGGATLKLAWTTTSLSYLFGGSEETIAVGPNGEDPGPQVITRQFLCVSSAPNATLAPSWRVSANGTIWRQSGYIAAVLL